MAGTLFSQEQQRIIDLCLEGKSFFFTGNAGTGKSTILKEVVEKLRSRFGDKKVAATASSGTAAKLIGGQTLHSWAGIGLGKESRYQLLQKVFSMGFKCIHMAFFIELVVSLHAAS
eukprot:Seg2882.2 transcript_id=Seg2882.2/GoldUCD/mRNA.D3Y31 product="ATP-dependent DNA helicase RRM3" protein_id=Seg2882.2/GoldUCD/D3Y31